MAGRQPYRQGGLDALCAVYAIINATQQLHPMDLAQATALFSRLVGELEKQQSLRRAVVEGIWSSRAWKLLRVASCHMREQHGLDLQLRRPFRRDSIKTIEGFYAAMERELGPGSVAIIEVAGALDHWTVLRRVTPKTLQIHDSLGHRAFLKTSCQLAGAEGGARFEIGLSATMIVQRFAGCS